MTYLTEKDIFENFKSLGYIESHLKEGLFLVENSNEVCGAYYATIEKRSGKIRLGGGIGVYAAEFENIWMKSISKVEKKLDKTLPLIMIIDNFVDKLNDTFFEFSNDINDLKKNGLDLYNLCSLLPNSTDSLRNCFLKNNIINFNISQYLHIFEYNKDNNIYLNKSILFILWAIWKFPDIKDNIISSLDCRQIERLLKFEKMNGSVVF